MAANDNPIIISRNQSIAQGNRRYFTGEPCKKGHFSERWTHNAQCDQCLREWHKKNTNPNRPTADERRAYQSTEKYHAYKKKVRQNPGYKEKANAHSAVWRALKKGMLTRSPCEVCQNPRSEGHHEDYSKPLKVRWLCRRHHQEHHRNHQQGE